MLLILLGIPLMTSCANKLHEIPLIIYDMGDNYMSDFEQKIRQSSGDIAYHTYDSQNSQIIQNEIFETLLSDGYRLFVINPVDRLSVFAMIEKAEQVGATIIFINREPLKSDMDLYENVYYIGADAAQSGRLQAELVMSLFGNNPTQLNDKDLNGDNIIQTVILKGEQGHQDAEQRTDVVIDYLKENQFNVEVLEIKIANFDMQEAAIAMETLLNQYGNEIEVVIANNDAMAIGAIETLNTMGYFIDNDENDIIDRATDVWMPVVGIDGLDIAIEQIQSGFLYGTVLNDSISMALALNELVDILFNEKDMSTYTHTITSEKYVWIDYQILSLPTDE